MNALLRRQVPEEFWERLAFGEPITLELAGARVTFIPGNIERFCRCIDIIGEFGVYENWDPVLLHKCPSCRRIGHPGKCQHCGHWPQVIRASEMMSAGWYGEP